MGKTKKKRLRVLNLRWVTSEEKGANALPGGEVSR